MVLMSVMWFTALAGEREIFVDGVLVFTGEVDESAERALWAVLDSLGAVVDKAETEGMLITSPFSRFVSEHGGMSGFVIDGQDALAMVSDENALVLDVRSEELQTDGYIRRSLNIPLYRLLERLAEIPKDRTIIVFCASDIHAAYATAILIMNHFDAFLLEGGIQSWREAGGRVSSTCAV